MKLFISQPMKGKSNAEIECVRTSVINLFKAGGGEIEVLDSFFKDAPAQATPLWYLGESIKLLGEADVVFFCKGWQRYNGCTIEHECAVRYGKEIFYA